MIKIEAGHSPGFLMPKIQANIAGVFKIKLTWYYWKIL